MDKYVGKRLDGRYEIHELIGVGGMANVYRCTDTLDDREVAIKILKDEYLNNEEFSRRFKNESKAIAMLSHPNIVKVYDVSFGDMIQYIVMEYIDGITLKEYIDRQGIIEWKDVIHLTTQVLKALQHAHESGIVHLQDGTIKVTDFGIARFSDKATRTMTDQAIGSVHYISPEQARGDQTDGKSDIYSVGVMLYEMLTGRLPFDGDTAVSVALMQLQQQPKRLREVNPAIPIGLEQITMKAMQKKPGDRYASAAEMLNDIERFRLNPSIVFDYGAFVDNQPTKHVNSIKETAKDESGVNHIKVDVDDEPDYDEEPIKEHSPFFYVVKGVLISAVAVCLIFFVLAMIQAFNSNQTHDVMVPDFVGKTLVAVKEDNPNNFVFEVTSKYDESKMVGEILAQEPAANSMKVKTGSTITLTVNGTDTEVTVPFISSSSTEQAAVSLLKEKSLMPQVVYVESTKQRKGTPIDTFPAVGSKTTIGSTVYLFVANGERPEQVEIPSVLNSNLSEAQAKLEELGLTVEVNYNDESKAAKDTVLSSSPLPYGKVEKGTVVTLNVSSGVGDKRSVELFVDLPTSVQGSVEMTVIVDGAIDSNQSKTVIPAYNSTYTLKFEGSGTSNVIVQLDGQIYREYTIDFAAGAVTNTVTHEYQVATTAPATEYVEPVTQPDTEPAVTEPSADSEASELNENNYGY